MTQLESPQPPRKRRGRTPLIVIAAVLAAGGAAFGTVTFIEAQQTPGAKLSLFLQAIMDGDADAAHAYVREIPNGSVDLLTDEVLDSARGGLEKFEVLSTSLTGAKAVVTVALTQDDTREVIDFEMTRVAKNGLFDEWQVNLANIPSPTLSFLRPPSSAFTVNGVEVPELGVSIDADLYLFPGRYKLSGVDESGLFNFGTTLYDVAFQGVDAKPATSVTARLSETGEASARVAVDAHIASCLAQQVLAPAGCGFYIPADEFTDTGVTWTMVTGPTYRFGESMKAGFHVLMDAPGSVRFDSNLWLDGEDYGPYSEVLGDWHLSGDVTVLDDGTLGYVTLWE